LLPFFWTEIAPHGQLYGNQAKGSIARVTNDRRFSYPGYNEIFTGHADPRIDSNKKIPNPNITVFEWLQGRPGFSKRVAALATWDVFPSIFNCSRSGIPIWPTWEAPANGVVPPKAVSLLLEDTTSLWDDLILDSFMQQAALSYIKEKKPRVLFLGYGETDEWAHEARYDLYLQAANHVDRYIKSLWELAQSIPQYRDKTTFIITADHGRGSGPSAWKNHGAKVEGAEGIWLAVLGPDTPKLGERTQAGPIGQNQIAATIAALLGEDYPAAFPQVGAPIAEAIARK
jgi:arylsulfatase A-like enzyme